MLNADLVGHIFFRCTDTYEEVLPSLHCFFVVLVCFMYRKIIFSQQFYKEHEWLGDQFFNPFFW